MERKVLRASVEASGGGWGCGRAGGAARVMIYSPSSGSRGQEATLGAKSSSSVSLIIIIIGAQMKERGLMTALPLTDGGNHSRRRRVHGLVCEK